MSDGPVAKRIDHGIQWGAAEMTCGFSDAKTGAVTFILTTPKADLQIYVTRTGKVRVFGKDSEWTAP